MRKFEGILLCSDFDQTMGISGVVTPKNCEAIRYFQQNGGLFTIVSGRNPHYLKTHQNGFAVNAPLVGYNGALILDHRTYKILYEGGRQDTRALDLAEMFWERDAGIRCVMLHDSKEKSISCHREKREDCVGTIAALRANCRLPVYNTICRTETPEQAAALCRNLAAVAGPDFEIARSWEYGVEIICQKDKKGAAALRLKDMLGARLLVTAGDYENDISMLQAGDISYAVKNALPHVKTAAKRHTVHFKESAIAAIVADLEKEL